MVSLHHVVCCIISDDSNLPQGRLSVFKPKVNFVVRGYRDVMTNEIRKMKRHNWSNMRFIMFLLCVRCWTVCIFPIQYHWLKNLKFTHAQTGEGAPIDRYSHKWSHGTLTRTLKQSAYQLADKSAAQECQQHAADSCCTGLPSRLPISY